MNMNILSSMGLASGHSNPEKWAILTSKDVECHKQPMFIRPVSAEEKIRLLLNKPQQCCEPGESCCSGCQCSPCCCMPETMMKKMSKTMKKPSYWHEMVKLEGFPMEMVRAFWAPHHRCVIITARTAQMDKTWKTAKKSSNACPRTEHFMMENVSPLTPMCRWTEEKNLHRMKRIIPVPSFVCAKDMKCFMDTNRGVIIVCARRPCRPTCQETTQPTQEHWIDKECVISTGGCEQEMHQRCQPTKALLKSLLGMNTLSTGTSSTTSGSSTTCPPMGATCSEDWHGQCKSIPEDRELQVASHALRHHIKEMKRDLFPGMLMTPRFVKDEKSGQWTMWLQMRLRSTAEFRPEDVIARADEKRNCIKIEARREVRECLTRRVAEVQVEVPMMTGALVDLTKMRCHFGPNEGILRMQLPLNRDKIRECCQMATKI